jgi:hypothetical protein
MHQTIHRLCDGEPALQAPLRGADKADTKDAPKERPDKPAHAAPPPPPPPPHGRPASTDRARPDGSTARRVGARAVGPSAVAAEAEASDVRRELEARKSELREKEYMLQVAASRLCAARRVLHAAWRMLHAAMHHPSCAVRYVY